MKRKRTIRIGAVCAAVFAILAGSSFAYYSSNGGGSAAAAVYSLTTPVIGTAAAATGGTVELKWTGTKSPDETTVNYYVTRNGGLPAESCPDVNTPESVLTCTDTGLSPGTYEYKVIAVWNGWTKSSVVKSATVTVGPVAKFTITGNNAAPAAGVGVSLTITAKDSAGGTVTTFTGSHSLVFSGASNSPSGTAPTVTNSSGTAISFGSATALTFTSGATVVSSTKNGVMTLYKVGEQSITATEGSLTTPVALAENVTAAAAKNFVLSASSTTPTAGSPVNLTIKANDSWGNLATSYTGSHSLTFTGASNSPNGTAPTVENSSGTATAFGTATAINFNAGVATVGESKNGEMILYLSGSSASVKAAEGTTVTTTTGLALTVSPATAASLVLTASTTSFAATTASGLTETAKDAYGNTATSYTGEKKLTFTATGAAGETSLSANAPTIVNNAGTAVALGGSTAITFTNGIATQASSKNGYLRLYKAGTASMTVGDGTIGSAALAFTVTAGAAKKVAVSSISVSAGTVSNPCYLSCSVFGLGNSGTISAALTITDEYGNPVSNIGSGKTVTVSSSGTAGSSVTGSPLTVAETGTATTTTKFTFTAPNTGTNSYTNSIALASTGYTGFSISVTK